MSACKTCGGRKGWWEPAIAHTDQWIPCSDCKGTGQEPTDPTLLINVLAEPGHEPDLDYAEAKRQARALLGQSAEVNKMPSAPLMFRSRVGVWLGSRFVLIGVGETYRAALEDTKTRQKLLEDK